MSVYIYLYNGLTFDEERDDWGDEGPAGAIYVEDDTWLFFGYAST